MKFIGKVSGSNSRVVISESWAVGGNEQLRRAVGCEASTRSSKWKPSEPPLASVINMVELSDETPLRSLSGYRRGFQLAPVGRIRAVKSASVHRTAIGVQRCVQTRHTRSTTLGRRGWNSRSVAVPNTGAHEVQSPLVQGNNLRR